MRESTGYRCPLCSSPTGVVDTRLVSGIGTIRRRRRCVECAHRFTTYEMTKEALEKFQEREAEMAMLRKIFGKGAA